MRNVLIFMVSAGALISPGLVFAANDLIVDLTCADVKKQRIVYAAPHENEDARLMMAEVSCGDGCYVIYFDFDRKSWKNAIAPQRGFQGSRDLVVRIDGKTVYRADFADWMLEGLGNHPTLGIAEYHPTRRDAIDAGQTYCPKKFKTR